MSKVEKVVYVTPDGRKFYDNMPKGYVRVDQLTERGKAIARDEYWKNNPVNALSEVGGEVIVTPNSYKQDPTYTNPRDTDQNLRHRVQVQNADQDTHDKLVLNLPTSIHDTKMRLYNNINPSSYDAFADRVYNALVNNKTFVSDESSPRWSQEEVESEFPIASLSNSKKVQGPLAIRNALWAKYLGLGKEDVGFDPMEYLEVSPYRPPHAKEGEIYYRFKPELKIDYFNQDSYDPITYKELPTTTPHLLKMKPKIRTVRNPHYHNNPTNVFQKISNLWTPQYTEEEYSPHGEQIYTDSNGDHYYIIMADRLKQGEKGLAGGYALGTFTYGKGKDEQGEYESIYDEWDLNPIKNIVNVEDVSLGIGTPIKIYDRKYK